MRSSLRHAGLEKKFITWEERKCVHIFIYREHKFPTQMPNFLFKYPDFLGRSASQLPNPSTHCGKDVRVLLSFPIMILQREPLSSLNEGLEEDR